MSLPSSSSSSDASTFIFQTLCHPWISIFYKQTVNFAVETALDGMRSHWYISNDCHQNSNVDSRTNFLKPNLIGFFLRHFIWRRIRFQKLMTWLFEVFPYSCNKTPEWLERRASAIKARISEAWMRSYVEEETYKSAICPGSDFMFSS